MDKVKPPFPIEFQFERDACIPAAASSLISYRGWAGPTQIELYKAMKKTRESSGFAALASALRDLNASVECVRLAIPKLDLEHWMISSAEAREGFLISKGVANSADTHTTVIFYQDGTWWRADPGSQAIEEVDPSFIDFNYAGDIAVLRLAAVSL
jgi:hypothetical protein